MSSDNVIIDVKNISKVFPVYDHPYYRLMQMLSRRNKARWHKDFAALQGVSISVSRGETVGIVGRNGSGKSTLLQIICGTMAPTSGVVEVKGRVAALLELGSGFNPEFTGRENVLLNGMVLGLSEDEVWQRFESIADFAEIGDFMERPVRTYSSGMYVRLAFAVAINATPDILIVDEALSVGDEAFQRKCFSRINQIRDNGATIIFVSHSTSMVIELCDRAVLLDRGEVLTAGTAKYVMSRYQKLLYSPVNRVTAIRAAIKMTSEQVGSVTDGHVEQPVQPQPDNNIAINLESQVNDQGDQSYYQEGMVPKSGFRYDSVAAVIEDPHVETLGARRVNVLMTGREYVYTYKVRFDRPASGIRCGMLIKSVSGLELAGSVTSWEAEGITWVDADSVLEVRFRFPCMFASGAYFLNAGVQGSLNGEDIYLDRWIDATMFKVIHQPGRLATTKMDLGIVPEIEVKNDRVVNS
ncbi:MAG: ABC transporter ATP-binding protein [Rhodanobacter sp.]|nr:MAG: ABC transporter ATP-binding protein [Rhodanobacter sp.]